MVREGLRNVTAGSNPMSIKRGIEKAVEAVVEQLHAASKDVGDEGADRLGGGHLRGRL